MIYTRTLLAQLLDFLPMAEFRKCVRRYRGDRKVRKFSCLDQFLCMAVAQLAGLESLRSIEVSLRSVRSALYHVGLRGRISRSTLADANESRDWRIYADFASCLIKEAKSLYADEPLVCAQLDAAAYALDSTTIDLCLSLFPWAYNQQSKSAVKMHTLMNLRGDIPELIHITGGKTHDVCMLDIIAFEPGAFYVMDRGYLDFARLFAITTSAAFFITRAKRNLKARRRYSSAVDKSAGIRSDHTIMLTYGESKNAYPHPLRRIRLIDPETEKKLIFLTNNFVLPAATIAALYKARWRIEAFFKWIKQNLKIKSFYGTSPNAVKTQIWIAIIVYVLAAIVKKQLKLDASLYTILLVLDISLLEKKQINSAFAGDDSQNQEDRLDNQLTLFAL
jgi:hypothetical protein